MDWIILPFRTFSTSKSATISCDRYFHIKKMGILKGQEGKQRRWRRRNGTVTIAPLKPEVMRHSHTWHLAMFAYWSVFGSLFSKSFQWQTCLEKRGGVYSGAGFTKKSVYIISGWCFQPLWKIWKSVRMIIPNIWKNQTTNQICFSHNSAFEAILCRRLKQSQS